MNLKKRLQALERLVVPPDDGRCEACGYVPGLPVTQVVTFRGDEPVKGPDFCPDCGRQLIHQAVIRRSTTDRGARAGRWRWRASGIAIELHFVIKA